MKANYICWKLSLHPAENVSMKFDTIKGERIMKKKIYLILSMVLVAFIISPKIKAYPYSTRRNCNTSGQFNSATKVTVYGDSRMDYIGGNDFVNNLFALYLFPWKQKEYVRYAKYSYLKTIVSSIGVSPSLSLMLY